jgi:lipopolysaccharide assembly outer membrane protein LptD (OstA)
MTSEPQTLAQLPFKLLEETIRQLRSTRNDIIRFGVWNARNLTDDEFNRGDDRRLFGYFRQAHRRILRHRWRYDA